VDIGVLDVRVSVGVRIDVADAHVSMACGRIAMIVVL